MLDNLSCIVRSWIRVISVKKVIVTFSASGEFAVMVCAYISVAVLYCCFCQVL